MARRLGRAPRQRGGLLERHERLADFDALARLDVDLGHFAGMAAGDFDRGLVGLQFDNALFFLDLIAFADQDFQDVAGLDAVAQIREV